jgi:hypothetical protein
VPHPLQVLPAQELGPLLERLLELQVPHPQSVLQELPLDQQEPHLRRRLVPAVVPPH